MMNCAIRQLKAVGLLCMIALAASIASPNLANASENIESLIHEAELKTNALKPYYTSNLEKPDGFKENKQFITLFDQAKTAISNAEKVLNPLTPEQKANYDTRFQTVQENVLKAARIIDTMKTGKQLEEKRNALHSYIQSETINEQTDSAYTALSEMISKQERTIGKISGKKYRELALDHFVTPAKVTKETIIYEVSIYRLQSSIKEQLYANQLSQTEDNLSMLHRLEQRAIDIKKKGNELHPGKYPSLPKAELHLSHMTIDLETQAYKKLQGKPTPYDVTSAGNRINGGQFAEDNDWIYSVHTWGNSDNPIYINEQSGLYRQSKDNDSEQRIDNGNFYDIQLSDHWIYYLAEQYPLQLYKIWKDGSEKVQLTSEREAVNSFFVQDDWIYYETTTSSCSSLYKMRPDGSEKVKLVNCTNPISQFVVIQDTLYFGEWTGNLYKINTDGTGKVKISDNISQFLVENDWIYFIDVKRKALNKVKTDGSSHHLLTDNTAIYNYAVDSFNIDEHNIYYTKHDHDSAIYAVIAIDRDGKNERTIGSINTHSMISILNGRLYGHSEYNLPPVVIPIQ